MVEDRVKGSQFFNSRTWCSLEKKASIEVERQEVAQITVYDFGRKKNGLALMKSTEEEPSHLLIRRRAG